MRFRSLSGRHPIQFPKSFGPRGPMPFGFCSGGFTSTPGYVPDNEVQPKLHGLAAQRLIISFECHPFLSGRSDESADSP